jgi:hypothetical protein
MAALADAEEPHSRSRGVGRRTAALESRAAGEPPYRRVCDLVQKLDYLADPRDAKVLA